MEECGSVLVQKEGEILSKRLQDTDALVGKCLGAVLRDQPTVAKEPRPASPDKIDSLVDDVEAINRRLGTLSEILSKI